MNIDESVCLKRVRYLREYVFYITWLLFLVILRTIEKTGRRVDRQVYPSNYDFEILSNREVIFLLFCYIRRLII